MADNKSTLIDSKQSGVRTVRIAGEVKQEVIQDDAPFKERKQDSQSNTDTDTLTELPKNSGEEGSL